MGNRIGHESAGRSRLLQVGIGLGSIGVWAAALSVAEPVMTWRNVSVVVGAAIIQLGFAYRANDSRFAGTRAFESSSLWTAALFGAGSAFVLERMLLTETAALAIVAGAFLTGLLHAVAQEVSVARSTSKPVNRQRAVVVGTGEEAAEWFALVKDHPEMGIDLIGCIGDRSNAARCGLEHAWLAPIGDLEEVLERENVTLPIVAVTSFRRPMLQVVMDRLLCAGHDVAMWWGVGRLSTGRMSWRMMSHEAVPIIRAQTNRPMARLAKRTFDVVVASMLLLVSSPILLLAGIAIRLDSSGSIFFRQRRVGLDGKPFDMIKLRSMKMHAEAELTALKAKNEREGALFKMDKDPRVTRIGELLRKTSLDELPQLWNVLKGEMSLVGPRPALVSETEKFDDELAKRNSVRPGLTGLWQLESRANPSFAAYKRLDLHYLENWSFGLDLRIAIATAQLLVLGAFVHPVVRRLTTSSVAIETTPAPETPVITTATEVSEPLALPTQIVVDPTPVPVGPSSRRIGVLGAGYVGLTQALGLADLGHKVICADINEARVEALRAGISPILEEGIDQLLESCVRSGQLTFTSDPLVAAKDAEFVFLCVPTPQSDTGAADLSFLDAAAEQIGPVLPSGTIVVNKSTVPVGSTKRVSHHLDRDDVPVVSNPEFLREGTAIADWQAPDRIVVGGDEAASYRVLGLYDGLPGERIACDAPSAELIKYASNAYLATRLTFVNSISSMCKAIGANARNVTAAMGLDNRIGPRYLEPGPGWGGSCLPKDTHALAFQAEEAGVDFQQLQATISANEAHLDQAAQSVIDAVKNTGGTVGVLGIAFKAGTGDVRESPAVKVMTRLVDAGLTVRAYDPAVTQSPASGITVVNGSVDAARDADVLVVATEWPEFRTLDLEKISEVMKKRQVVDLRNHLDPAELAMYGFEYSALGTHQLSAGV